MDYLKTKLMQPSTHAAIAALLIALGQIFPGHSVWLNILAATFGGGAAAMKHPSQP